MEMKRIVSVLGDDRGRVVSAREISKLPALTNPAAAGDVLLGKEFLDGAGAKQIGELVVKSGYELLGSGSYTWAGGSATLSIPVSYTGTAKQFGAIAVEPIADTAQSVCFCELTDAQLLPSEFAAPDHQVGYGFAWGHRADNTIVLESYTGGVTGSLSASQISVGRISTTYPWKANTYNWYIWGVAQ